MSTRAMYTFEDAHDTVHVYKHGDGYPEGALSWIGNARNLAWPLPRFEADEFAAAFVAANKRHYGDVRLCGTRIQDPAQMAGDAEYHYKVTCQDGALHVAIYEVDWWRDDPAERTSTLMYEGLLDTAIARYGAPWLAEVAA